MSGRGRINSEREILLVHRAMIVDEEGKVLFIQRSEDDRHMPGYWEFPGGKMEQGENLIDCLDNEVKEETGLKIKIDKPLACYNSFILDEGSFYPNATYVVIISICRIEGEKEVKLSGEHQNCRWVSLDEIDDLQIRDEQKEAIKVLRDTITQ